MTTEPLQQAGDIYHILLLILLALLPLQQEISITYFSSFLLLSSPYNRRYPLLYHILPALLLLSPEVHMYVVRLACLALIEWNASH